MLKKCFKNPGGLRLEFFGPWFMTGGVAGLQSFRTLNSAMPYAWIIVRKLRRKS